MQIYNALHHVFHTSRTNVTRGNVHIVKGQKELCTTMVGTILFSLWHCWREPTYIWNNVTSSMLQVRSRIVYVQSNLINVLNGFQSRKNTNKQLTRVSHQLSRATSNEPIESFVFYVVFIWYCFTFGVCLHVIVSSCSSDGFKYIYFFFASLSSFSKTDWNVKTNQEYPKAGTCRFLFVCFMYL